MRRLRIHTFQDLRPDAEVALEPGPARHVLRVLRRSAGDAVVLFNGGGQDWPGRIVRARGAEECVVALEEPVAVENESPLTIHLVQALCRAERMDWAVQKAVELGVAKIWPVETARCEVRLKGPRAEKRRDHWQKVVISACEQSGRARVPAVAPVTGLAAVMENLPDPSTRLRLETARAPGLAGRSLGSAPLVLAAGPEGGLDERDCGILDRAGFLPASLGPRVLRTETAGPAALSVLQALYGDMG